VTGLASIDVSRDLSRAGQIVLIFLFQVGGLGILTFSAVFFVILGRGLASKGTRHYAVGFPLCPAPGPGVHP